MSHLRIQHINSFDAPEVAPYRTMRRSSEHDVLGIFVAEGEKVVRRLLASLGPSGAVWPFGTGWRALDAADLEPLSALLVEVYPSMFDAKPAEGEFKDQAQRRLRTAVR